MRSLYWAGLNKSKRPVRINLRSGEGQELAQAIIIAPGAVAPLSGLAFGVASGTIGAQHDRGMIGGQDDR